MTNASLAAWNSGVTAHRALTAYALLCVTLIACGDDSGGGDAGSDAAVDSGGAALCRPGETNFGGECADPQTSIKHCGLLRDEQCTAPSDALPICTAGECGIDCNPPSDADAGVADGGSPAERKSSWRE